jgi:hypothetical protein
VSGKKISELVALTTPADNDLFPIVDISEPATVDKNKSITYGAMVKAMVAQNTVSGTTYSLSANDDTRILKFTNASGITVTIASGLSSTFSCMAVQLGTGQITFTPASGVTRNAPLSATKTAYQYGTATLLALSANNFLLTGDVTS